MQIMQGRQRNTKKEGNLSMQMPQKKNAFGNHLHIIPSPEVTDENKDCWFAICIVYLVEASQATI